jgi:hypothetical protein
MPQKPLSRYEQLRAKLLAEASEEVESPGIWSRLTTPLWEGPSRLGRSISDKIREDRYKAGEKYHPLAAFGEGAIEAAGDVATGFTSPLNIGLSLLAGGPGILARSLAGKGAATLPAQVERLAQLFAASKAAGKVEEATQLGKELNDARKTLAKTQLITGTGKWLTKAGSTGFMAEGGYNLAKSINTPDPYNTILEDPSQFFANLAMTAGGAAGSGIFKGKNVRMNRPSTSVAPPTMSRAPLVETPPPIAPPTELPINRGVEINRITSPHEVTPHPRENPYGITSPTDNPLTRLVPEVYREQYRSLSPTQQFIDQMLPARIKELIRAPKPTTPTEIPKVESPMAAPTLPESLKTNEAIIKATEKAERAIKQGPKKITISDVAKGLEKKEAAWVTRQIEGGNADLAALRDAIRTARKEKIDISVHNTLDDFNHALVDMKARIERPYAQATDENLNILAKANDRIALIELEKRAQENLAKEAEQPVKPLTERLKSETGALNIGSGQPVDFQGPLLGGGVPILKYLHRTIAPGFDRVFKDWVNERRAAKISAQVKAKEFTDLDPLGFDAFEMFQSGNRSGRLADVEKYFNTMYDELKANKVDLRFKQDYLPQMWDNPKAEVNKVFERRLTTRPSFTLRSVYETYKEGIEHGLTPKYDKISDLINRYEHTARKTLADRKFFQYGQQNQLFRTHKDTGGSESWKELDKNQFRVDEFLDDTGKSIRGPFKAPAEIAEVVNGYLKEGEGAVGKMFKTIASAQTFSKNLMLSSGIPLSTINAHGFNTLARNTMARGPMGLAEALKYMTPLKGYKWAGEYLDSILPELPDAVKHGLVITTEEHFFKEPRKTFSDALKEGGKMAYVKAPFNALAKAHGTLFEDPLFQNVLPAMKFKYYKNLLESLTKDGKLDEYTAKRTAALTSNNLFGGINWEEMMRSRDLQNVLRSVILAPDWFETQYRMGKGVTKGIAQIFLDPGNPEGKGYRQAVSNLIMTYAAANVVNYINTKNDTGEGRLMAQNPTGHSLNIYMGKSGDRQQRYFNLYGTSADFVRLPFTLIAGIIGTEGNIGEGFNIGKNRMAPIARMGLNLFANKSQFNRPITGKDTFGRPIPKGTQVANVLQEFSGPVMPQYVKGPLAYARGQSELEPALLGTVEAPFRYHTEKKVIRSKYPKTVRLPRIR